MDKKLAVIVGVGPLLGKHLGLEFASHGFDVVLIARNEVSLKRFKQEFDERKYNAYIYTADCSDFLSLDKTFDLIVKEHGIPNVFIYNTGITTADPQHLTSTDLERHFRVDTAAAYHLSAKLINDPRFKAIHGTLLFTGGGLATAPSAQYLPLSMDKAALRAMAYALNESLKKDGSYVGTVTVCDVIGKNSYYAPENIARDFYKLYETRSQVEIVH